MILTGKAQIIQRKTCLSVSLPTTNFTWTGQGSNIGLQGERSGSIYLSHCMVLCPLKPNVWNRMGRSDMMSLRAGPHTLDKKNISCCCGESNHDSSVFQAIA